MNDVRHAIENSITLASDQCQLKFSGSEVKAIEMAALSMSENAKLLLVAGVGTSANAARKFRDTLATISVPALFMDPVDALHGRLGLLPHVGLAVLISNSGRTEEILILQQHLDSANIATIAITSDADSPLAQSSTFSICYGRVTESDPFSVLPTVSILRTLMVLDALLAGTMIAVGVSAGTLLRSHPSGSLGQHLRVTIGEIIPEAWLSRTLSGDVSLAEASQRMSELGFGGVVIQTGSLLEGVLSDGDLRRLIARVSQVEGSAHRVRDLMNKAPICLDSMQLVQDVAAQIRKGYIRQGFFPVVGEGHLVGVLMAREVLAAAENSGCKKE